MANSASNPAVGQADLTTWLSGFQSRLAAFDARQKAAFDARQKAAAVAANPEAGGIGFLDFVQRSYYSGDFNRNVTTGTLSESQAAGYGGSGSEVQSLRKLDSNPLSDVFDSFGGVVASGSFLLSPENWSPQGIVIAVALIVSLYFVIRAF